MQVADSGLRGNELAFQVKTIEFRGPRAAALAWHRNGISMRVSRPSKMHPFVNEWLNLKLLGTFLTDTSVTFEAIGLPLKLLHVLAQTFHHVQAKKQ